MKYNGALKYPFHSLTFIKFMLSLIVLIVKMVDDCCDH